MTTAEASTPLEPGDVVLQRWQRFGHDRTYVRTTAGVSLGYRDNRTGEVVAADPDRCAALRAHLAAAGAGPSPTTDGADTWVDLAGTAAGAAARARAVELRQAAPIRTVIARALRIRTEERAWRIGADGEESVAAELARLGDRWRVLHAVTIGSNGADIDHVVIGPAGAFTINTKHHPHAQIWARGDTVMVNGTRVPYVRNSRFEASRASRLLTTAVGRPVPVTGIIALTGCREPVVKAAPNDGVVLRTRRNLVTWLRAQPDVLGDEHVQALFAVARRSPTWS